nr:protein FAR1-related sequence 5 [Tanacetum cinerariifolium]
LYTLPRRFKVQDEVVLQKEVCQEEVVVQKELCQEEVVQENTKNLIPAALRNKRNRYGEKNVVGENFANEPTSIVDHFVHLLSNAEPRSESENSFFSHFTNYGSTLMNFINCFETAMEKQMHVQEMMDHKTIKTIPKLKTFLTIERHASNVYTRSLFKLVQKEIFVGLWHCQIDSKSLVEGFEVCIIKESPYVYEMPKKKKNKPQSMDKGNDKAEEDDTIDLFFKKTDFIRCCETYEMVQLFVHVSFL